MPATVVLGAQWGDEGKGKVVDILAEDADLIVRFQGGNNAGHTLVVNGEKTVLHLIPSGILHESKTCVIASGVVIDPRVILTEIEALREAGVLKRDGQLQISEEASVILPYHVALDLAREEAKGANKIGTTGRGIGPCYEDKAARKAIFMRDLLDEDTLRRKVVANLTEKNVLLSHYGVDALDADEICQTYLEAGSLLEPFITNADRKVYEALRFGSDILFEGAQGSLLDVGLGTYPYVTSSHTTAGSVCVSTGIAPSALGRVYGVTKAYATRVGSGPFPTELEDTEVGIHLQTQGHEFGSTTGRPRRCGWLDLPALKYAVRVNGITDIVVTKLDVLSRLEEVRICTHYTDEEGRVYDEPPRDSSVLDLLTPVYETFPGWSEDITSVTRTEDLPLAAQDVLGYIRDIGVRIDKVSVGPDREQTFSYKQDS